MPDISWGMIAVFGIFVFIWIATKDSAANVVAGLALVGFIIFLILQPDNPIWLMIGYELMAVAVVLISMLRLMKR